VFIGENQIESSTLVDGGSRTSATGEDLPASTQTVPTQKWKLAKGNENLLAHYTPNILSRIGKIASCTIIVDRDNDILEIKAESKENLAIACDRLQNLQKSLVSRSAYLTHGKLGLTDSGGMGQAIQT
jgi:hypothetical protein